MRRWLIISSALLTLLAAPPAAAQTWSPGFGQGWVRSQPFTLGGLNIRAASYDAAEYRAAGFSSLLAWDDVVTQVGLAAADGMPWHVLLRPTGAGVTAAIRNTSAAAAAQPGGLGWLVEDEPSRAEMPGVGAVGSWLRGQYPGSLVYTNAFPSYASAAQLFGDDSNPAYDWETYLSDLLELVDPDVLVYDHYPFHPDGQMSPSFFSDLMTVRRLAIARGIPYWTFVQSWSNAGYRLPSESDLRMQLFTHLAAGYTGIFYFTYDAWEDGGLLTPEGAPSPLYAAAAEANAEVVRLGHVLRYLRSLDLRYLRGQLLDGVDNPVPAGVQAWSVGAGSDPRIRDVRIDTAAADTFGLRKNGQLAFFSDDEGGRYFMLVNLSHRAGEGAESRRLTFQLEFESGVSSLTELNRATGEARHVPLRDGRLRVSLLGGTGRLYAYGASASAGRGGAECGSRRSGDATRHVLAGRRQRGRRRARRRRRFGRDGLGSPHRRRPRRERRRLLLPGCGLVPGQRGGAQPARALRAGLEAPQVTSLSPSPMREASTRCQNGPCVRIDARRMSRSGARRKS